MDQILRAFSATVDDVDDSDRTIVSKISVGSVDRYNSLILPRGIDLKAYVKNPVVLFEHGKDVTRGAMPIGRNVWVKLNNQGNTLIAKTRFAKDEFSSTLYDFYRDGTMTGWSVRLLQKELGGPPTREESRSYPGMEKCDIVYRSTELAEYSATSVPGNSDCISEPELRSMFSEAQLESLSTLVVRGFWTPPDELKPIVAPIVERMTESDGMASGGALVDDDGDGDEEDDDSDDDASKKKKKKKKKPAEAERSADEAEPIETAADDGEMRSIEDVETVEPEAADTVERAGFDPNEPRDGIGEWTDGAGGKSEESKAKRRKSRPSLHDKDGGLKKKPTAKDVAKLEKLQAKYDRSPIYKTPDLKDEKTGEVLSFRVVKNSGYHEDPGEYKYYAQTTGSKEGDIDNEGFNNPAKAAKAVDASYKRWKKELGKRPDASRSAPDDADPESDDDFIGEWFDYVDGTTEDDAVERSAPESEPAVAPATEAAPAAPEPVDPLAGLPPIAGRSLEDVSLYIARRADAWRESIKSMFDELERYHRGEV